MPDPLPQAWLEFPDGRMHWLDTGPCTIGRIKPNSLVLELPGISRNHAMIQPAAGGGHLLTDLRSTNGTFHNGIRIEAVTALRDGDTIEFGDLKLAYRCQQTTGDSADSGATSVQIHSGDCWLMMLDLIGHTAHTHAVGAETASADFKRWLELIRPILVRAGGTINAYLGDAIFAYWRQDKHPAGKVGTALRELVNAQTASLRPFRLLLHHGKTRISGGMQGESLSGPEVIYLFRIEKATKGLGSDCILSEPAAKSLSLLGTAKPLGSCEVQDYPGSHRFYGLQS